MKMKLANCMIGVPAVSYLDALFSIIPDVNSGFRALGLIRVYKLMAASIS